MKNTLRIALAVAALASFSPLALANPTGANQTPSTNVVRADNNPGGTDPTPPTNVLIVMSNPGGTDPTPPTNVVPVRLISWVVLLIFGH